MPDEIDEYYAKKKANQDIDDYYASKRQNAVTSEPTSRGWWGRLTDLYDRFDQSWLPEQDFSKEEAVENRFGRLGRILTAPSRVQKTIGHEIADATVGSPVRLAGAAATLATGPFGIATKLGAAAKPVGVISRGLDAVDALRTGTSVVEDVQSGNVGAGTVGKAVGAGILGASAITPVHGVSRTGGKPVPKGPLEVTRELPEPVAPHVTQVPGGNLPHKVTAPPSLGQAPISTKVLHPPELPALPEKTFDTLNRKKASGTVVPVKDVLLDRAAREFDALEIPANNKNMLRYRNDTEFRTKIQKAAEAKLGTAGYSPVQGTKYVQEAPVPKVVKKDITIDDVRQAMIRQGMVEPSDAMVARIRKDPEMLSKLGLNEEVMEGVPMPPNQVKGYLVAGPDRQLADQVGMVDPLPVREPAFDALPPLEKISDVAKKTQNPDLKATTQIFDAVEKRKNGLVKTVANNLGTSIETELSRMGDAGKEIARQLKIVDTDSPIRFNSYIKDISDDVRAMDDKTFTEVVDVLEGGTTNNQAVEALASKIKTVLDQTGSDLNNAGLLEKGVAQNYWPRRYDGVPEGSIRESLRASGKSEDEIRATIDKIREFREQKTSAEFSRNMNNLPGYRKDKDVLIDHLRDVSKRIESASVLGAKDVADGQSPISKLIAQTSDPERARDLVTRAIRGGPEASEVGKTLASGARKYATASQLSLAAISNFGGMLPVLVRGTVSDSINAIGQAFNKQLPEMRFMENANLFKRFSGGFAETVNDNNKLYKLFGIEGSQNWLNRYAAAVGNGYAKVLFDTLKNNPNNTRVAQQLEDLVLDSPKMLLGQDELTPKQIERAMVRMADITQGSTDNRKLPYGWVTDGVATIPQIFLRTAFQTSKAMYDAIGQDPVRALPKLAVGGWLIGEVIGDTKEAVKTGAQVGMNSLQQKAGITTEDQNFVDQYKKNIELNEASEESRMSFARSQLSKINPEWAKSDFAVRSLANYQQAFALGLPADLLETMAQAANSRNPAEVMASFFWAFDEANTLGRTGFDAMKGNVRDVSREALKRTPIVGRGAAREVDSTRQSEKGTGKSRFSKASW